MKGFVNVCDFGATGDGVSDDTTAIQNALNAISMDCGGTVFFPSGTYVIKVPLVLRSVPRSQEDDDEPSDAHFRPHTEFHLLGSGDARLIAGALIDNIIHLTYGDGIGDPYYTHIENLQFDGRYRAKSGIVSNWSMHVSFTRNKICNVENGIMYSVGQGVGRLRDNVIRAKICIDFYDGGGDSSIESNDLYPLDDGIGIMIRRGAGNTTIANNIIRAEGHTNTTGVLLNAGPVTVDQIRDLRIRSNKFSGMRYCVFVDGGSRDDRPVVYNILVDSNHVISSSAPFFSQMVHMTDVISPIIINNFMNNPKQETATDEPGIYLEHCQTPVIVQNVINFLRGSAIKLLDVQYGVISGNTMRDNGQQGEDYFIVDVGKNCNHNIITGNTIIQTNPKWGRIAISNADGNQGNLIDRNLISIPSK